MPSESPQWLQLHLEPDEPIEVGELTGALSALARQYAFFARSAYPQFPPAQHVRLLISNVSPGSIDINFVTDAMGQAAMLWPFMQSASDFAEHLRWLLSLFAGEKDDGEKLDASIHDWKMLFQS